VHLAAFPKSAGAFGQTTPHSFRKQHSRSEAIDSDQVAARSQMSGLRPSECHRQATQEAGLALCSWWRALTPVNAKSAKTTKPALKVTASMKRTGAEVIEGTPEIYPEELRPRSILRWRKGDALL